MNARVNALVNDRVDDRVNALLSSICKMRSLPMSPTPKNITIETICVEVQHGYIVRRAKV